MNNTNADPLADLRDIHLPDAIGWWPPAPGWWFMLGLVLLLITAGVYFWRWLELQKSKPIVFSKQDMMQAALLEFSAIEQRHANSEPDCDDSARQMVADISQLLRRCAVQLSNLQDSSPQQLNQNHTPHYVAGYTGEAWLSWLDQQWDQDDFKQGCGRILIDAPYRQSLTHTDDLTALISLSRAWMEQQT